MDRALNRWPSFEAALGLDAKWLRRGAALAFLCGVVAGLVHARALGLF